MNALYLALLGLSGLALSSAARHTLKQPDSADRDQKLKSIVFGGLLGLCATVLWLAMQ